KERTSATHRTNWDAILPPVETRTRPIPHEVEISFANSRPAGVEFPIAEFRRLAREVIDSESARDILQLGSAHGYPPLRKYLVESAMRSGAARASDDVMVTNGCQQALDLVARVFAVPGAAVLLEDPSYHGLIRVFARSGWEILSARVDEHGVETAGLEKLLEQRRPRLLVVNPNFQNPTGATLPFERRLRLIELARRYDCVIVESDIYSELRYSGTALPTVKELDYTGSTILLRSYSKVSFPGLRVGWIVAPRPVIGRLADAKEISDLHSDQLSQAVLLRFAESGELGKHMERTRRAGAERLDALLQACADYLPEGVRWTRPEGGMNLWIELPAPLLAEQVLTVAREAGVAFMPGSFFSARLAHARALRISFGGLTAGQIVRGIRILGDVVTRELGGAASVRSEWEASAALV
ncbi:MAG: PLP-dependent aminotransferase family protein, partial [Acidobacteriaceae bacterium]|nr:PLP-dependent aminotransferase family protein [Acidobacteriaceae bacterium]